MRECDIIRIVIKDDLIKYMIKYDVIKFIQKWLYRINRVTSAERIIKTDLTVQIILNGRFHSCQVTFGHHI